MFSDVNRQTSTQLAFATGGGGKGGILPTLIVMLNEHHSLKYSEKLMQGGIRSNSHRKEL